MPDARYYEWGVEMTPDNASNILLVGLIIGVCVGALISTLIVKSNWQTFAIEHNAAQYNHITGDFEWLDEVQNE